MAKEEVNDMKNGGVINDRENQLNIFLLADKEKVRLLKQRREIEDTMLKVFNQGDETQKINILKEVPEMKEILERRRVETESNNQLKID